MALPSTIVVLAAHGDVEATVYPAHGESAYHALTRAGVWVPTRCRGSASCGLCAMVIVEGGPTDQPAEDEARLLRLTAPDQVGARLLCKISLPTHGTRAVVRRRPDGEPPAGSG